MTGLPVVCEGNISSLCGSDGWTPTKPGSGSYERIDPDDELDDIEGLSREDLDALRFEQ